MKKLLLILTLALIPSAALAVEYIPIPYRPGVRDGGISAFGGTVRADDLTFSRFQFLDFTAGELLFSDADSAEWAGGGTYTLDNDFGEGVVFSQGIVEGVALQLGPRWPFIQPETGQPHPVGGTYPATMELDLDGGTMTIHIESLGGVPSAFGASASLFLITPDAVTPVPEPASLLLLGTALLGLAVVKQARR